MFEGLSSRDLIIIPNFRLVNFKWDIGGKPVLKWLVIEEYLRNKVLPT